MATNSPGFNRQLERTTATRKFTDLAVGTHVFPVKATESFLTIAVSSASGTANIEYTMDPEHVFDDGVAAPSTGWASGIVSRTWATGATDSGEETLVGPITAIRITVATAVATVVVGPPIDKLLVARARRRRFVGGILPVTGYEYTTDNYDHAATGTDSSNMLVSLWFKKDSGEVLEGNNFMLHMSGGRFLVEMAPAGQMQCRQFNSSVTLIQVAASSVHAEWLTDDAWHHFLYSRIGANSWMYLDDTEDLFLHSPNTNQDCDIDSSTWHVGMAFNDTFGWKGCLSNIYFNGTEGLDLSVENNRRKFITVKGEPVDPGVGGQKPTGSQPEIWMPRGLPTENNGTIGVYTLGSGDGAVPC